MKILISGNADTGLSAAIGRQFHDAEITYASRANEFDLVTQQGRNKFASLAPSFDVVIINAALWQFQQSVLLDAVWKSCVAENKTPHIISIGSTTDRVKKGGSWLYNAEKKALRDYCNTLALNSVWTEAKPKISIISFGTLSNNQEKHPDRRCMDIDEAAGYVKWLILQPKNVNINEISIDPMQGDSWWKDNNE